jgi:hypothetical protein
MRMRLTGLVFLAFACVATTMAAVPAGSGSVKVTGTYSNLQYNEEGGDLLGMEIKIVPVTGERLQAVVLVSDGAPAPMVLVDVHVSGRSITFKVPRNEFDDAWSFHGSISAKGLTGIITHGSGAKEQVTLPRRCGYWDR